VNTQGEMTMNKKLLTPKDVAAWLSIPLSTVYDYLRDGTLPGLVKIGRLVRVDADKLEKWLSDQEHKGQENTP
jgi:excisionase family DNA binding protein